MLWLSLIVLLSVICTGLSINRPVYKIVLKQKGYAQVSQRVVLFRNVVVFVNK